MAKDSAAAEPVPGPAADVEAAPDGQAPARPEPEVIRPRPRRSQADGAERREARIPPPPDDPGVKQRDEDEEGMPGRFRLF
jgi:hypothetical protein